MNAPGGPDPAPRFGLAAHTASFALVAAGSFSLARTTLLSGVPRPGTPVLVYSALLAAVPLSLLGILIYRVWKLVLDYRLRGYGSRLRAKLARQFVLVALLASVPHGMFLGALLRVAVTAPWSSSTTDALDAGFQVAVAFQEERLSRLAYLAERDAVVLGDRLGWDPGGLLEALREREPGTAAVEVFRDGLSAGFAGAERARLGDVRAASPGPLSRIGAGDSVYLRHLARSSGSGELSVAVSLLLPPQIDRAASALGKTRRIQAVPGFMDRRFSFFLAFYWFLFVLPSLAIALLTGLTAAETIVRPVAALEEAALAAAHGDLSPRLLPRPGDELGGLVSAWNRMLSGVEAARYEAAAAEKVAAWRDIAQRLAHELKNPLTPIRLSAERVLRKWQADPASVGEILEPSMLAILQEAQVMNSLLSDFRSFASLPEPAPDWTNLRALVEESCAPYRASFPEARFDAENVDPYLVLRVDRTRMRQALENLISNALDAMDGKGSVSFRSDLVKAAESRYCRLQIRDTGRGIPSEIRDRIFVPYFTTKRAGTGLGLSITERIVQDHGGRVRFESEPGSGTVFFLDLPFDS